MYFRLVTLMAEKKRVFTFFVINQCSILKTWLMDFLNWIYVPIMNILLILRGRQLRVPLQCIEQDGFFSVPYLSWYRASIFKVSFEGPPGFSFLKNSHLLFQGLSMFWNPLATIHKVSILSTELPLCSFADLRYWPYLLG